MVLFSVDDLEIIQGSPSSRRRNLDILLSQINASYIRNLRGYQRIVNQRNHLLRRIRDHSGTIDELHFWDKEMVEKGASIINSRSRAIDFLNSIATDKYSEVANENESMTMTY